jgi:putative transposase
MRKSKFTEEQIVGLLREAEKGERTVSSLCRERGITVQTYYRWRKTYGGIEVSDVRKLRRVERENARLKQVVGQLMLDNAALKALISKKW